MRKFAVTLALVGTLLAPTAASADHDYGGYECMDHDGCGGGGYSGGPSGGYYEGGKGGSDYDGDGDGPRCRNFCFYGIPEPGGGEGR